MIYLVSDFLDRLGDLDLLLERLFDLPILIKPVGSLIFNSEIDRK